MAITAHMTRGANGQLLYFEDCDIFHDQSTARISGELETPVFKPAQFKMVIELGDLETSGSGSKRALFSVLHHQLFCRYGRMIVVYGGENFIETMVNGYFFRITGNDWADEAIGYYIGATRYRNIDRLGKVLLAGSKS